jgi:filamentous hemagglutinin
VDAIFYSLKKLCIIFLLIGFCFQVLGRGSEEPELEKGWKGNHIPSFEVLSTEPTFNYLSMAQKGLLPERSEQIDDFKRRMKDGSFKYDDYRQISGLYHEPSDTYFISEGHHRLAAALEIAQERGDWSFFNRLIQKGYWSRTDRKPKIQYPLKTRKTSSRFHSCSDLFYSLKNSVRTLFGE